MCRTQCVLALVALYVGLAHSLAWDYVVTTDTTLEFYDNATLTHSEYFGFGIKYLTYDAVQNRLLFLDGEKTQNIFLHSLNLATMERQSFFMRKMNKTIWNGGQNYIRSLAYDPVTELVFFSDSEAIFWFSLKPGFKNNFNGNLLIKSTPKVFSAIAVDSSRGYIYWTYEDDMVATIERARLNGSDRKIVEVSDPGSFYSLVIDQQTQTLYWINEYRYEIKIDWNVKSFEIYSIIISRHLNEGNRENLCYEENPADFSLRSLTVSKDFIYFMDSRFGPNITVWKVEKDYAARCNRIYTNSFSKPHNSIVANYKIEHQTRGVKEDQGLKVDCEALVRKNSVSNDNSLNVPTKEGLACQNYCIQGNCSVIEGQAICRCNTGYSGERCEVDICRGYCLNDGVCYLNAENGRVCQCKGDYRGERCDVSGFLMKCFQTVSMLKDILNADVAPMALDNGGKSTCGTTIS